MDSMKTNNCPLTWIDFLLGHDLDQPLLLKHLQNENPDPSAIFLLEQFLENRVKPRPEVDPVKSETSLESDTETQATAADDSTPNENSSVDPNYTKKLESLKLMAIQTAAHLSWDLDILATLPLNLQLTLMQDLREEYVSGNDFLASLLHRWVLRSTQAHLKKDFVRDPLVATIRLEYKKKDSENFLEQLIEKTKEGPRLKIPIPLTFKPKPNPPDFNVGIDLEYQDFNSMLHIELGIYYLYKNLPNRAKHQFAEYYSYTLIAPEWGVDKTPYFHINPAKLKGFMLAVGLEIPKLTLSQSKRQRKGQKEQDAFKVNDQVKALEESVRKTEKIAQDLRECNLPKLKASLGLPRNAKELKMEKEMESKCKELNPDKIDNEMRPVSPEESLRVLQKQLIETGDQSEVKKLLAKLFEMTKGEKSFTKLFPLQDLPNALKKAIDKLPAGQIKDYVYIAIAKSQMNLNVKMYQDAKSWLHSARSELSNEISVKGGVKVHNLKFKPATPITPYLMDLNKLFKILRWETLLIEIARLFGEWPARGNEPIVVLCKEFLASFAHPAFEANPAIAENVLMVLINVEEYETVVALEVKQQKWAFLEFLVILATACSDLKEKKESASSFRALWNAVLPIFYVNEAKGKAGLLANRSAMTWVIERCKSQTLVSLFVSLLVRLHNHVVDDITLQIQADFTQIWPNILDDVTTSTEYKSRAKGGSKLNIVQICDTILTLLQRLGTKEEQMWLKCIGDVHLSADNSALALKSYLEYFSLTTDGFENASSETWKDEYLLTKMIKCCELLGSFTEALILTQFFEVVNYTKAFGLVHKSLGKTNDSNDSLYGFIWDFTILECIINGHRIRKQTAKLEQAAHFVRVLELNPENTGGLDGDARQEVVQLRKFQFMRTLANRYIFA